MKMSEVNIKEELSSHLKQHKLIEVNYTALMKDFNFIYADMLEVDHPEEFPKEQLAEIKGNIFSAFCYGAVTASDPNSNFRKEFNVPAESKIITPDKKIVTNDKGEKTTESGIILG